MYFCMVVCSAVARTWGYTLITPVPKSFLQVSDRDELRARNTGLDVVAVRDQEHFADRDLIKAPVVND